MKNFFLFVSALFLIVACYLHKSYGWLYSLEIQNILDATQLIKIEKDIQRNPRVALYVGSFDPVHAGHIEAIEATLREMNVAAVVVLANNPNKGKPQRSSLQLRIQMLKIALQTKSSILISMLTPEEATEIVKKHANIIGILDSDQLLNLLVKNKPPKQIVDQWFIVTRDADKDKIPVITQFFNKPVTFARVDSLKLQNYSSSYVRQFLSTHNDFYLGKEYNFNVLPLLPSLQEYLRYNLLY